MKQTAWIVRTFKAISHNFFDMQRNILTATAELIPWRLFINTGAAAGLGLCQLGKMTVERLPGHLTRGATQLLTAQTCSAAAPHSGNVGGLKTQRRCSPQTKTTSY